MADTGHALERHGASGLKVVDTCFAEAGGSPPPSLTPSVASPSIDGLEAVRLFTQTGSLAKVAAELKCSLYDLKKLTRTDWWQNEYAALRAAEAAQLNVELTQILDGTLEALKDRVANGDMVFVGGLLKRAPLPASVLARVAEVVFDKRQVVRGEPTSTEAAVNSKLEGLARQLRALGARDIGLLGQEVVDISPAELPSQERYFGT